MVLLKNEGILPLNLDKGELKTIGLIGDAFKSVYYGDYSGRPDNNPVLLDCLLEDVGERAELKWINERTPEELIPVNYLTRSADQAYDGILGFTGEYFANKQGAGKPKLVRQDLNLDFTPDKDKSISAWESLSARWTSTLQAPLTGKYVFSFSGSGEVKVYVDDALVVQRTNHHRMNEVFELSLVKGSNYDIRIESNNINLRSPFKLTWRPPFDESVGTPETIARNSDVVILFLRDDNSSEGRDRKDLKLSSYQVELIKNTARINPNTILVLGSGSALSLSSIIDCPKALLNVWIAGQGEAQAISDILLGKVNPSGKTAVTFFANEEQLPAMDDYDITKGRSYQYFDGDILFPFGFGLSYTDFEYSKPRLDKNCFSNEEEIVVTVDVKNSGGYDGEEIVQCYVSSPNWQKNNLKQKLVGYKRVFLKQGETKKVQFSLSKEDILRWNLTKKDWEAISGKYEVSVVSHSGLKNLVSFDYL